MFYSPSPNRRKSWLRLLTVGQKKLMAVGALILVLFVALLSVLGVYAYRAMQYDMSRVGAGLVNNSLFDSQGSLIASLAEDEACVVTREELPQHLINAFVAREDERFFEHNGVVISSVIRSVLRNLQSMRYEQGASTITMQLTRNVYEMNEKTLDRKLLEALLAQRIEREYDKDTILTQYLNRIYFGQNCYGVAAAAHKYFGKHVSELNLVECATLAGLVRAPSLCNPVTSMDNAMGVKKETLARMLEMEFITQEEHDLAVNEPIVLAKSDTDEAPVISYATMWARRELDDLRGELGEHVGGISVVTNLDLELQKLVEISMEKALVAVEKPGNIPDEWLPYLNENEDEAKRLRKFYDESVRRPAEMKVRGMENDMAHVLQCCVMVVDSRRNNKGRVLAMVSGRSAVDGRDRWGEMCMPGNAMAPFLYSCACLPGGDNTHIVARKPDVTGRSLGYDVVRAAYEKLALGIELPGREEELALYRGLFKMRRVDLARILFDIQNEGRNYKFSVLNRVWSRGGRMLYAMEPVENGEYIRREGAGTVAGIPPFIVEDGKPVVLNETLPENHGIMCMVFNHRGVAVFVWMGFDDPADMPSGSRMSGLMKKAAYCLASELHTAARARLKARAEQQKKS